MNDRDNLAEIALQLRVLKWIGAGILFCTAAIAFAVAPEVMGAFLLVFAGIAAAFFVIWIITLALWGPLVQTWLRFRFRFRND